MSDAAESQRQPSEEEVREALERELARISADDMVMESAVSIINLGARRAGLAPGTESERDPAQLHTAIEAVRALLPVLEGGRHADKLAPLRDALSRLQLAYASAREPDKPPVGKDDRGEAEAPAAGTGEPTAEPGKPDAGPAQRSGRLWVPGQ
ncbi:MAG TPA: hypothetical protein VHE14_02270 [Solirubrobacteraceae bacterium]|nr:hypothetical protein [Solirubrobacteraceae bacterium]